MVIGFLDREGATLHAEFQTWRQENDGGFFLTFGTRVLLHATECWHAGGVLFDGFVERNGKKVFHSLTKNRKVCSADQAELLSWADSNDINYRACSHCIHDSISKRRLARVEYFEQPPANKILSKARVFGDPAQIGKILEGILKEITTKTRSRSHKLRLAVLDRAEGVCEACQTDFSKVLNGLGARVLQAHHRKQLALLDTPTLNGIEDLAVLCANCHLLIHANMKCTLSVAELRRRLAESGLVVDTSTQLLDTQTREEGLQ